MSREPPRPAATAKEERTALDCGCVVVVRTDVAGRKWRLRAQRCMRRDLPPEHRWAEPRGLALVAEDAE